MQKQNQLEEKWTVVDLINVTANFLKGKGIENPRLNAELLLAEILNYRRVDLYVNYDRPLKNNELSLYRSYIKRRAGHEPLQYIIGEIDFMGLTFQVNPAVLIPRPETELLVDHIIKTVDVNGINNPQILEIGTGSGCITVSLAHYLKKGLFFATDISSEALEIAKKNADKILSNREKQTNYTNNQVHFIQHDFFSDWPGELPKKFDLLVSNPPYIAEKELTSLTPEVIQFEPKIALCDGADGLSFYKRIFDITKTILQVKWLFLEMSGSQPQKIVKAAEQYPFKNIQIRKDLNGIDRLIEIRV